jgi:aryl-alcohol dehydrogenase-like predicted oxidoreductase
LEFSTIDAVGNANYLRRCAYMSARRLSVERIDLYYLHSGRAKDASFEDQVGTLAELRQLGLIRHIGLSNVIPNQLRAARQIVDIAAVTAHFNVVDRQQAPLLNAAWTREPSLSRGNRCHSPCLAHPRTPAVRRRSVGSSSQLRPGTTSIAHIRENLDAQDIDLSREDMQSINHFAAEGTATKALPFTPVRSSL